MIFYSTNHISPSVTLKEAVLKGLADDNGLFMPEFIAGLPHEFLEGIKDSSFTEIAFQVSKCLLGKSINDTDLRKIIEETINFDAPLVKVTDHIYALELFHGPTLAFKDFGARFMARLTSYFNSESDKELLVLVATSGDTGSAVASGFLNVKGTRVVILYPSGKVSKIQEQQLTTAGNNIMAIEVEGSFDDCQRMVKKALSSEEIQEHIHLTSANSINIARLIPQSFYYFYAYAQLLRIQDEYKDFVISVPSGNFGNLTAGLLAKSMGLPIRKFIASTNVNAVVPEYLSTGIFKTRDSVKTISNAMDVGNPSNFVRMLELYGYEYIFMHQDIEGYSFNDKETADAMRDVYKRHNYIMDPHGAVGYLGLKRYMQNFKEPVAGIFLETAHPSKFKETVEEILEIEIALPEVLQECMKKEKKAVKINNTFEALKKLLLTDKV